MLKLIDLGADDVEEDGASVEVYTQHDELSEIKGKIEKEGYTIISAELQQIPSSLINIADEQKAKKAISFLENLENHDDVQRVFSNVDIPQELVKKIDSSD